MASRTRGGKRSRAPKEECSSPKRSANVNENSPVILAFKRYQEELDTRYDKYERIVKCSRDLTIHSKRAIFTLQRIAGAEKPEEILEEGEQKLNELKQFLKKIATELLHEDPYQFTRAHSPGIQEYIEALSFYHYLKHGALVSYADVLKLCSFSTDEEHLELHVSPSDYILGVADLTGELMRLCLNSAANGDIDTPFKVCSFMRQVHDDFVSFGNCTKDIASKLRVLKSSLYKVERACYTLQVRGSEIPKHMLADMLSIAQDEHIDDY